MNLVRMYVVLGLWALQATGVPAQSAMEWVRVPPVMSGARIAVHAGPEASVVVVVQARTLEAEPLVVAHDGGGRAVTLKALGSGNYLLPRTPDGVVTVRARVGTDEERLLRVYAGDFGAALRLLATEKPDGTVLEKDEWGQWLRMVAADWREQRLRELMELSIASSGPFAGAVVEDYLYLLEVTRALKSPDVVRAYRGKELPIRVDLPQRAGRKPARFDALLRLPAEGEAGSAQTGPAPLLVRVHGRTANPSLEGARLDVAKIGWEGVFPFMVLSPVCNKVMKEENWDTEELAALVELVREKLPVDGSKVFLTGFSMGGYTTLKLANERPDLFTAWAAVCGWGDVFNLAGAAKRPGWLIHGERDPVVLPYESVRVYRMLRAMGAPVRLTMYTGVDHNAWDPAYRQASFYEWLLAQRAEGGARPPVVPLEAGDALWVHEQPLTLKEALSRETLEKKARALFALYPAVTLVGDLTLLAPEGLGSEDARCFLGVPVKGDVAPPAGFSRMKISQSEGKPQVRRVELSAAALVAAASEDQADLAQPMLVRIGEWNVRKPELHAMITRLVREK